jgi:hypothetical protein
MRVNHRVIRILPLPKEWLGKRWEGTAGLLRDRGARQLCAGWRRRAHADPAVSVGDHSDRRGDPQGLGCWAYNSSSALMADHDAIVRLARQIDAAREPIEEYGKHRQIASPGRETFQSTPSCLQA